MRKKQLPASVVIGKSEWQIQEEPEDELRERYGGCMYDTKTIHIYNHKDHRTKAGLFSTFIHEIIHARNKSLSEKAVSDTEEAIMRIFRQLF